MNTAGNALHSQMDKDLDKRTRADEDADDTLEDAGETAPNPGILFNPEKEQDLDDLVHEEGEEHPGTMPDPETLKFRESQ